MGENDRLPSVASSLCYPEEIQAKVEPAICLSEEEDPLARFTRKYIGKKRELCFFFTPVFTMFSWCLHIKAATLSLAKKRCKKHFRAHFHSVRVNGIRISKKVCVFSRKRLCVKEPLGRLRSIDSSF